MSEQTDFVGKMVVVVRCNAKHHVPNNGICICHLIKSQAPVRVIRRIGCCGLYFIEGAVRSVSFEEFKLLSDQPAEVFVQTVEPIAGFVPQFPRGR